MYLNFPRIGKFTMDTNQPCYREGKEFVCITGSFWVSNTFMGITPSDITILLNHKHLRKPEVGSPMPLLHGRRWVGGFFSWLHPSVWKRFGAKLSNSDDPGIPSCICSFHCKEGINQHQLMSCLSHHYPFFILFIGFYTSQVVVWDFFHQSYIPPMRWSAFWCMLVGLHCAFA